MFERLAESEIYTEVNNTKCERHDPVGMEFYFLEIFKNISKAQLKKDLEDVIELAVDLRRKRKKHYELTKGKSQKALKYEEHYHKGLEDLIREITKQLEERNERNKIQSMGQEK
jgi:hypothetical protein